MTHPAPTFGQIRARVKAVRRKMPDARAIGIQTPGRWNGDRVRQDGEETYRIEQCDSSLAARIALLDGEPGVTVTVRGDTEQRWRAKYLIGADGAHSTVRTLVGVDFPGKTILSSVVLADVKLAHGPTGGLDLPQVVAQVPVAPDEPQEAWPAVAPPAPDRIELGRGIEP